jgi:orotidine-5'-phosphate decarboxylase
MNDPRIIVALDFAGEAGALSAASRLDPALCRVKVGKELYTAAGPALVEKLLGAGFGVFLDLKFHDIPNTVAAACAVAADLGVWMVNVHALGGRAMMSAARDALSRRAAAPKLVAVTLLTSLDEADLREVGLGGSPQDNVLRLARLARDCGLDGVVCSTLEVRTLRAACGPGFCLVTPGIRLEADGGDDQKRIAAPGAAIAAGADYLVIGRPVTRAADPASVLHRIDREVAAGLGSRR